MDGENYYVKHIRDLHRIQPYILKGVVPTGRQLGHGAFGSVIEMRMVGGALCAGKKIHDALIDPQNEGVHKMVEKFVSECELMSKMRHPNIVSFYGLAFIDDNAVPVLVMEQLDRSLENYLERTQPKELPFSIRISILYDVVKGLVFLHSFSPPIIHRDLTARNVLLTTTKQARISDLGNSRIIDAQKISRTLSQMPGTLLYMPPEAFVFSPKYDASLDMFSFGQVALFMLNHEFPSQLLPASYPDSSGKLLARSEIERREHYIEKLETNQVIPPQLIKLVRICFEYMPERRPTSKQVAEALEQLLSQSDEYRKVMRRMEAFGVSDQITAPPIGAATVYRRTEHLMKRITGGSPFLLEMRVPQTGFNWRRACVWKKYLFELIRGEFLKYYAKLNDKKHHVLNLEHVTGVDPVSSKEKFQFVVKSQVKGDVELRAETQEDRDCWVQALRDASGLHCQQNPDLQGSYEYVQILPSTQTPPKEKIENEPMRNEYEPIEYRDPPSVYCQPEAKPKKDKRRVDPGPVYAVPPENDPVNPKKNPPAVNVAEDGQYEEVGFPTRRTPRNSGDFSDFTQDQLSRLLDLLSQQLHDGSHYSMIARAPSPQPSFLPESPPLYDDTIILPKSPRRNAMSGEYAGRPIKPGELEEIYDTIDDEDDQVPAAAPVKQAPKLPPKPSYMTRKPMHCDKPVTLAPPAKVSGAHNTEDEKRQTIKSLTALTKSAQRSAISMLIPEDECDPNGAERGGCRRPSWAEAKTTNASMEAVTTHDLEAIYIPSTCITDLVYTEPDQFGEVLHGKLHDLTGELVDVTVKSLKECKNEREKSNFEREMVISTHPQMKHPNIAQVYGIVKEENWIVTEYLPLGDLKTFLMNNTRPARQLIKYMLDIAMGMYFLSEKGLVHRSLAARNVLMGPKEICKVSDFGLLRQLPDDEEYYVQTTVAHCPARWTAPESLTDKKFSSASDVWSYGILVWEMFNPHGVPFEEYDDLQVVAKVATAMTPDIPANCPDNIARLMKSCWRKDPSKRSSFLLLVKALTEMKFP